MKTLQFEQNQLILFIGDSITDTQRRETPYAPLGQGYVHFAANFLAAKFPHLNLRFENRGISGDTTRALLWRWKRDCLSLEPDIVSILVGINDLWRQFANAAEMQRTHVPAEEYRKNLKSMINDVRNHCHSRIVLMEPFYFTTNQNDPMAQGLIAYIEAVHELADEFNAVLVLLQSAYEKQKNDVPEEQWAWDKVHPHTWAHAWIARQWLLAASGPEM